MLLVFAVSVEGECVMSGIMNFGDQSNAWFGLAGVIKKIQVYTICPKILIAPKFAIAYEKIQKICNIPIFIAIFPSLRFFAKYGVTYSNIHKVTYFDNRDMCFPNMLKLQELHS